MSLGKINVILFGINAVLALVDYIKNREYSNIHSFIGWGLATMCQAQLSY